MEPSLQPRMTPMKIGKMYLNRFTIDEDAAYELLGVYDMKPSGENFHRCKSDSEMDFRKDPSDIETIDACIEKAGENAIFFYAGLCLKEACQELFVKSLGHFWGCIESIL